MQTKQITTETFFYGLAFSLALGLRLFNIGTAPLSDLEAVWALQAWDLSQGVTSQPAYVALTRGIFFFLGSSNALARLWPALTGSALVLIPISFRSTLGRTAALILAFGLALDPGLIAISRLVGSPMMAISFTALALTMFYRQDPAWGGVFSALALLSGASIWIALSAATIVGIPLKVWSLKNTRDLKSTFPLLAIHQETLKTGLKFGLGIFLVVGTLFFSYPAGLSAWAQDVAIFIQGWVNPTGISASSVVMGLVIYAPLAFIFSFVMGLEHEKFQRPLVQMLFLWVVAVVGLVLVYPGRQVADSAWALVPIWILAALGLARYWRRGWKEPVVWGQAVTQFIMLLLVWMILAGSFHLVTEAEILRSALLLGLLAFGALTFIFIGLGWSWLTARRGLALGFGGALVVYGLAVVFSVLQVHPVNSSELWLPPRSTGQADLLLETLQDLSLSATGQTNNLIGVARVDSPALRWVLRNFSDIIFTPSLETFETSTPPVILALPSDSGKLLTTDYRGQDFVWQINSEKTSMSPTSWQRWLIFREAPSVVEKIVLWVREDLFLDDTSD
jgi:hypothetical protein